MRSGLARFRRATRRASRTGRSTQRRHASDTADRRTERCLDVETSLDARLRTHLGLTRSRRVRSGALRATGHNDPNFVGHEQRSALARFPRATRRASRTGRPAQRRGASRAPDRRTELCLDVEIPLDARLRTHLSLTRSRRVRTGSPLGRGRLAERRALEERRLHLFARKPEQSVPAEGARREHHPELAGEDASASVGVAFPEPEQTPQRLRARHPLARSRLHARRDLSFEHCIACITPTKRQPFFACSARFSAISSSTRLRTAATHASGSTSIASQSGSCTRST